MIFLSNGPGHNRLGATLGWAPFAGQGGGVSDVLTGLPGFSQQLRTAGFAHVATALKGKQMSKGDKSRGNKEAKKPKQEKQKVLATANSGTNKVPLTVAGKKIK